MALNDDAPLACAVGRAVLLAPVLLVLVLALAVAAALASTASLRRRLKMRAAAQWSSIAAASPEGLRALLGADVGGVPAWLRGDAAAAPAFLNEALAILWPRIDRAATRWALTGGQLAAILNDNTFWRPGWLAGSGVSVASVTLGQAPPRVTGVRVLKPAGGAGAGPGEALVLDLHFEWASRLHAILAMRALSGAGAARSAADCALGAIFRAVPVKVQVRDLVARGTLRVTLAPLLDRLPVVGAARLAFLEAPTVSYSAAAMGVSPALVPGLEAWLDAFIKAQALRPFTFPEGLVVDVAGLLGLEPAHAPAARPEGLLSVELRGADGVPRTDAWAIPFASCGVAGVDPFVVAFLTEGRKQRSSTRGATRAPRWDGERFDFPVHAAAHQALTLQLWDADALGRDDLIGEVEVLLSSLDLAAGAVNALELKVPLAGTRRAARGRAAGGELGTTAPAGPAGAAGAPGAPRLERRSALVAVLGRRPCTLRVDLSYVPFTPAERRAAGPPGRAGSTARDVPPRIAELLASGVLTIYCVRATGLPTDRRPTARWRVKVKIGVGLSRGAPPALKRSTDAGAHGLAAALSSSDPVLDSTAEVTVSGGLARAPGAELAIELHARRLVGKPSLRGRVTLPLARIVAAGRLHEELPLDGGGRLEVVAEWLGHGDAGFAGG